MLIVFTLILAACSTVDNKRLLTDNPDKPTATTETTSAPSTPEPTATPQPQKIPEISPSAGIETSAKPEETPKPQETSKVQEREKTSFKIGDKGSRVKEIQQKLNKFGYKLSTDGIFGKSTYYAVTNFQRRLGISVDGVVGPATMAKLNKKPTPETMYKPDSSTPASNSSNTASLAAFVNSKKFRSNTNFFIWIDHANRRVNVFQGSQGNWKLLKSMPATIGASRSPTVKGTFTVKDRGTMFRVKGTTNTICKYWTRFYGNYLFHSVLLNNDGSIRDGRLGMRLSHGCVRLSIANAKFIYDNIPAGTTVWSN